MAGAVRFHFFNPGAGARCRRQFASQGPDTSRKAVVDAAARYVADSQQSKAELIVEAGTGRVRRTLLAAKSDSLRLELTTTYEADERLGILVPTLFRESSAYGSDSRRSDSPSESERVVCEAQYNNFRRFETSVRVK